MLVHGIARASSIGAYPAGERIELSPWTVEIAAPVEGNEPRCDNNARRCVGISRARSSLRDRAVSRIGSAREVFASVRRS